MKQITISINEDKIKKIDEMAKQYGVSRSAFINMSITEFMKGKLNA